MQFSDVAKMTVKRLPNVNTKAGQSETRSLAHMYILSVRCLYSFHKPNEMSVSKTTSHRHKATTDLKCLCLRLEHVQIIILKISDVDFFPISDAVVSFAIIFRGMDRVLQEVWQYHAFGLLQNVLFISLIC